MYDLAYISNQLKKYIDKKVNKFIIYPFGENGINVKKVLVEYFNLEPCYIVDNEYSKYNPMVIDRDRLSDIYQNDMYVILTIENRDTNEEILEELSGVVPQTNIINLLGKKENNIKYFGEGFLLKDFLPEMSKSSVPNKLSKKIKVRIVHGYHTAWNAISSVCQAFKEDSLFDIVLITGDWASEKVTEQAAKFGFQSVDWNEYQGKEDKPDILILCLPIRKVIEGLVDCREYAKLVVVIYWFVVRYSNQIEFIRDLDRGYGIFRPDYYLFDSLLYNEVKQSTYYADKAVEMGNAKFDGIYHAMQKVEYADGWEKLQGKKIIVWTTTHGIYEGVVTKAVTFDLYAKIIFEYAFHNTNVGFIFRPSDELVNEMLKNGYWSHEDLRQLKEYCAGTPNMVFDDTDTYDAAFSIADGIITDAFCGIICSALPSLKPICVAYRSKQDKSWHPELTDNYYSAYEEQDIVNFIELIKNGQDPMYEFRRKASEKYVKHFDGRNGLRIKEFIAKKYFEFEKER